MTELQQKAADLEQAIRFEQDKAAECWAAHDDEGDAFHRAQANRMREELTELEDEIAAEEGDYVT